MRLCRPYRPALGINAALEKIVKNIGRICIVSRFTMAAPFDAQRAYVEVFPPVWPR